MSGTGSKAARERDWLRRGINLTYEQYKAMEAKQHGKCWLCRRKPSRALAPDHNHKTGVVRGLLCDFCNRRVIGSIEQRRIDPVMVEKYFRLDWVAAWADLTAELGAVLEVNPGDAT